MRTFRLSQEGEGGMNEVLEDGANKSSVNAVGDAVRSTGFTKV